ncbi:MAG: glycoside hydrolase family 2 TIM barrel-domain containing protein, partial [Dehalococcoidales bacterium]|nr:glycoside hydrolase family 2 TIM barrel-domain containing protein [Dehalococcoidales bacterium]
MCSTVKVVQHDDGQWQLLVDNQPYIIKGVCYNFWVIGDDPDAGTLRDWSILDLDNNGKNDVAYDSWVDSNKNNIQDPDEKTIGDWQLLKEMGCNTIRAYQLPTDDKRVINLADKVTFGHPPNKKLLRDLYEQYGIRVIIGHFFGEWTIGSGATWDKGTDYSDPKQRKNLLDCVKVMVNEHKNEPYTLLWMIGNENFNPLDHDN